MSSTYIQYKQVSMSQANSSYHIPYYDAFLPRQLLEQLPYTAVAEVPRLHVLDPISSDTQSVYSVEALRFLTLVLDRTATFQTPLRALLEQRGVDREFIHRKTAQYFIDNKAADIPYDAKTYRTVLGKANEFGQIPIGPYPESHPNKSPGTRPIVLPPFLQATHLTIFGPSTEPNMAYSALTSPSRGVSALPPIVGTLIQHADAGLHASLTPGQWPIQDRWGRDDEDSQFRTRKNEDNSLKYGQQVHEGTIRHSRYGELPIDGIKALPIKRIQGLGLPNGNWLYKGEPVPMHVMDLVLQVFHNHTQPNALTFYVPKLETEYEAGYVRDLLDAIETLIQDKDSTYQKGTIKIIVVLEDVRAVYRADEILDKLGPYAAGFSLGWHDFLASAATVLREDPLFEMPRKSDAAIVIKYVRASHEHIRDVARRRGCLAIGGMYGVLPIKTETGNYDEASWQESLKGFFKDVVTQMKRELDGFWVAHPDFMPYGKAIIQAYREDPTNFSILAELVDAVITNQEDRKALMAFFSQKDTVAVAKDDLRAIAAMNLTGSEDPRVDPSRRISHHNLETEVHYNIHQAFNYILSSLHGNGCVALSSYLFDMSGAKVDVRVMDDLATTRRSAAQVWKYLKNKAINAELFETLLDTVVKEFKQHTDKTGAPIWEPKWLGVAEEIVRKAMTAPNPSEFIADLLYPFTLTPIRTHPDPLGYMRSL